MSSCTTNTRTHALSGAINVTFVTTVRYGAQMTDKTVRPPQMCRIALLTQKHNVSVAGRPTAWARIQAIDYIIGCAPSVDTPASERAKTGDSHMLLLSPVSHASFELQLGHLKFDCMITSAVLQAKR